MGAKELFMFVFVFVVVLLFVLPSEVAQARYISFCTYILNVYFVLVFVSLIVVVLLFVLAK